MKLWQDAQPQVACNTAHAPRVSPYATLAVSD